VSNRQWGGSLRHDPNNGCEGDYNDSFEELNIDLPSDLPSLEGTQKFISPNITVMSDLLLLFHEISLQYIQCSRPVDG